MLLGKWHSTDLLDKGLPQIFICKKKKKAVSVKCNKAKHSKTKSAYMSSLEKMSIHILCPLLDGLFVFDFAVELYDLYINLSDI